MRVLVNRSEPAASQTAKQLRQLGHQPVVIPLFDLIDLQTEMPVSEFDGIVFTSRNAVEVLKRRQWTPKDPGIFTFCVGQKTAAAAETLGLSNVRFATGGGRALAELISQTMPSGRKLLYPSTPDRTFDMDKALRPSRIDVETTEIYQTRFRKKAEKELKDEFRKTQIDAVLVFSERSGRHLSELLSSTNLCETLKNTLLIGISETAVSSLRHLNWQKIHIADQPNEASLLDKLKDK